MKHLKLLGVTALLLGFTALGASAPRINPPGAAPANTFSLASVSRASLFSPAAPDLNEPRLQLAQPQQRARPKVDGVQSPDTAATMPGSLARLILLGSGLLALMGWGWRRKKG
jgi:hypothetical protein